MQIFNSKQINIMGVHCPPMASIFHRHMATGYGDNLLTLTADVLEYFQVHTSC